MTHGAIYYGALTRDRVYVRTTEKEFDFPQGQANAETVYEGKGGIPLSSFWRKLVVANECDGLRLFISGYFVPESRILLRRNIVERVERLAPFLIFDRDPYIVADGDHYSYIVDAYTSSPNYPYSEAYQGSRPQFHGHNYLRNSVKAVVDAYNGSVKFYVFDGRDPIIAAYRQTLPGLFKERDEMPENLRRHIRYPEDLFTVQAEMYGTYHMTDPTTFYNREDRWEVPRELYRDREIEMTPYYVMAELPNAEKPGFLLMLPLSVAGKNQMAGWLAGLSDGANYGKMVAFRFPKGTFVDGPAQVESRINSDSRFSGDLGPARLPGDPGQSHRAGAQWQSADRDRAGLYRSRTDQNSDTRARRAGAIAARRPEDRVGEKSRGSRGPSRWGAGPGDRIDARGGDRCRETGSRARGVSGDAATIRVRQLYPLRRIVAAARKAARVTLTGARNGGEDDLSEPADRAFYAHCHTVDARRPAASARNDQNGRAGSSGTDHPGPARHRRWTGDRVGPPGLVGRSTAGLVTVLGWVFLIRGAVLLYLSPEATAHLVDRFRFEDLFYVYLGLTMALGLYLTVRGFSARFARRPRE